MFLFINYEDLRKSTIPSTGIGTEHFSNFRDGAVEFAAWAIIDAARMISKINMFRSTN